MPKSALNGLSGCSKTTHFFLVKYDGYGFVRISGDFHAYLRNVLIRELEEMRDDTTDSSEMLPERLKYERR
ncbi:hypothetical protein X777_01897 [Ooceraea biroi]|uniref:Uncharacterized protein n=1 Tax=Ooceraea biroi TaxID=2015173 RepID=A0A026WR58_OOCBI|nr:hypothetical protein X777_01897 [Ooceraea biroi]